MQAEVVHAKDSLCCGKELGQYGHIFTAYENGSGSHETRFLFVKDLLKCEKLTLCKTCGTENAADLGTKVLDVNTHRHLCSIVGSTPVNQAVEEIKGHKRNSQSTGSVGLLKVWKGLRTLGLGFAQRAKENATSMNLLEIRI